jgi:hypothetical protein
MSSSQPKAVNFKRSCFKCQDPVYLNPNVRKQDNPEAFDPLDEPFDENAATSPPKFHRLSCKAINITKPATYNYEGEREENWPDSYNRTKPVTPNIMEPINPPRPKAPGPGTKKQEVLIIPRAEFEAVKSDIKYIKELLEAVIRAFDESKRSAKESNSTNTGLLFTKAIDMPIKEEQQQKETKTIEEDTKIIKDEIVPDPSVEEESVDDDEDEEEDDDFEEPEEQNSSTN